VDQTDAGYLTVAWNFAGTIPYVRLYGPTHATKPLQLEFLSGAKVVGLNVTSGTDPGHLHTQGGIIGGKAGPITVAGYLMPSAFRWAKGAGEGTQTLTRLEARVGTPPTGGSLVIQVRRTSGAPANSANVYTDAVATLLIGTITIVAGEFGGSTTVLTNETLADGETIVLKATTVPGFPYAADLLVNAVLTG
jgi:hypothetical protein